MSGVQIYVSAECYTCRVSRDGPDVAALLRWAREHSRRTGHETHADVTTIYVYAERRPTT